MNSIDTHLIELNKLSSLHNGYNIFFCKTDFIFDDFEYISKLNHSVTFISGNSDYGITDDIAKLAPSNIKTWYAQNCLSKNSIIRPIPIGLENKLPSTRHGHGIGYYDRGTDREQLLLNIDKTTVPRGWIYSNFNVHTNIYHRQPLKELSKKLEHIDWEEPVLTLDQLYARIMQYRMVLCPIGNGLDTHRLWEVLYLNRIPITIKVGDFNIYNLYQRLPIICLDNIQDLEDLELIKHKYNAIINSVYDLNLLNVGYWKQLILKASLSTC